MPGAELPDWLSDAPGGVQIALRVAPKAARSEIGPPAAGRLRVRVTDAPEKGKANAAVVRLLSKRLGVGRSKVTVAAGTSSRDKLVRVEGVTAREALDVLSA